MKKILSIMVLVLLTTMNVSSQNPAPGIFNYQGVARNSVGNVLVNKAITLRLTMHDISATGPILYQESRTVTTNPFGLFNVQVGSAGASNVTGNIAAVNLGTGAKFIQVEIDPNGGTAFINIGAAQLASVPYSLYSSLANDLVLPFNKTQGDAGALFKITNSGTGITLHTTGPLRLQGISEGANRILASDASGNATWKDPAAVNIVTGNGTVNLIPKWTPTGTNIGNSQIADNGVSIGINTITPNASAQLDVSSTTKGILIPRMTTAQRTAISTPANGLLVFDNTTNSFWFYNGTAWREIFSSTSGWGLSGNTGTNPAVNFIGTIDFTDVIFKRGNTRGGLIGFSNTSFGLEALNPASTGINNTASGIQTLRSNVSGSANTANGAYSLYTNTTGENNTAIGAYSLTNNTTGNNNTALGWVALNANITGTENSAVGKEALKNNTSGNYNTATGVNSLSANTTSSYNTAYGANALAANTAGTENTASGYNALSSNTTGSQNTAFGNFALISNTTGSANTALGEAALLNTTGTNNIGIGQFAQVPAAAGNNQVRIGNGSIIYAGIQVAWTITSDKRAKSDISNSVLGLAFIKTLNPVSYYRSNDESKKTEYGFIAQEVEEVLNRVGAKNTGIITKDDAGKYGMRYNDLIAPMVKAIQEQQVLIEKQQELIEQLKKRLVDIEKKLNH